MPSVLRSHYRRHGDLDSGFTLVEVMVAFAIIAIIAATAASLTIRAMRASLDARQLSQAKNVVNQQIETMRGLPFFVGQSASKDPVDVLDRHYPNLAEPKQSANCNADAATWLANRDLWEGYVKAGSTARCDALHVSDGKAFEPKEGAFYRTISSAALGTNTAAVVVATQFIKRAAGDGSPAGPTPGPTSPYAWDDQNGRDNPASEQIAVYVTAVYGPGGTAVERTTSRTDIANRLGEPLVSAETNATAVVIEGELDGEDRRLELGTVSGEGGVTVVTSASVEAIGGSMLVGTTQTEGNSELATSSASTTSRGVEDSPAGDLAFVDTQTSGVSVTSSLAAPRYGGPAIAAATSGSFSLGQNALGLTTSQPLVRVESGGSQVLLGQGLCPSLTSSPRIRAAGWMDTGPSYVNACARSEASVVRLFPDTQAEIQIRASDVIARCEISGSTGTREANGSVEVRWLATSSTFSNWIPVTPTTDMKVLKDQTLANGKKIGEYIASWAPLSSEATESLDATTGQRTVAAKVTAFALTTVGVRTEDPEGSSVRLTIGQASCHAKDRR